MEPTNNIYLIEEYKSRINNVFDFIENNLDKELSLEDLASVANFSKYHFHRVFYSMTGETPFQFILRLRLEKAANLLINNPKRSITEIAYECGFTDSAIFARSFKAKFNCSASGWRKLKQALKSNTGKKESSYNQTISNNRRDKASPFMYFDSVNNNLTWRTKMELNKSVEVKEFTAFTVAYVRYIGPYAKDAQLFERLFNKLFTWAGSRGLLQQPDLKTIVVYHDNLEITDEDKLRTSVCISVPPDIQVDGEIGKMEISSGKYVVARFEVGVDEFGKAWDWVYSSWFPSSGYQPADGPCFEMYPEENRGGKFIVDICVPVKPL